MQITKVGSQPSAKGPADWFTGTVRIDPLFTAPDPALVAGFRRAVAVGLNAHALDLGWMNEMCGMERASMKNGPDNENARIL